MHATVHLNGFDAWDERGGLSRLAERAVRVTLEAEGVGDGEVSVTCLEAPEIRELNRRWLDRDEPTDVLAFELGEGEEVLGDVYLCPEVARRSAEERGLPFREEVLRLVVHGTLHALGHDHPAGAERGDSPMFRRQEELLGRVLPDSDADAGGSPAARREEGP